MMANRRGAKTLTGLELAIFDIPLFFVWNHEIVYKNEAKVLRLFLIVCGAAAHIMMVLLSCLRQPEAPPTSPSPLDLDAFSCIHCDTPPMMLCDSILRTLRLQQGAHTSLIAMQLLARSTSSDVKAGLQWLDALKNYELEGVPPSAGTDTDNGFALVGWDVAAGPLVLSPPRYPPAPHLASPYYSGKYAPAAETSGQPPGTLPHGACCWYKGQGFHSGHDFRYPWALGLQSGPVYKVSEAWQYKGAS